KWSKRPPAPQVGLPSPTERLLHFDKFRRNVRFWLTRAFGEAHNDRQLPFYSYKVKLRANIMRIAERVPRGRECRETPRGIAMPRASMWRLILSSVATAAVSGATAAPQVHAGIMIGSDASNYAVLFEGGGANTLQITNVTVNGSVGVGLTGKATDSGPSTINGRLDFYAANTNQFSNNNASNVITGGVHYSVTAVATALSTVNSLNTTLGGEAGTS